MNKLTKNDIFEVAAHLSVVFAIIGAVLAS
jgi:hypothetical protein